MRRAFVNRLRHLISPPAAPRDAARAPAARPFAPRSTPAARGRHLAAVLLLGASLVPSLGSVGCAKSAQIPGTEIPDTPVTRQVLDVVEQYRLAFVRRDAAAIYALAHESYYDPMGTDDPSDDVDRNALGALLKTRLSQIHSLRFTIDYLSVEFEDDDRALVRAYIDASFRMKPILAPNGEVREQGPAATAQDYAEYELIRIEDGVWRLLRGI